MLCCEMEGYRKFDGYTMSFGDYWTNENTIMLIEFVEKRKSNKFDSASELSRHFPQCVKSTLINRR